MRNITHIVVHCTATPEGRHVDAATIRQWHLKQGWKDIGYHWVVLLDGTIQLGRPEAEPGAGVKGYNATTVHVVYVGGCDAKMKAKDTRTPAQKEALHCLLIDLKQRYPDAIILGHRDFPKVAKACPSFDAITEYQNL